MKRLVIMLTLFGAALSSWGQYRNFSSSEGVEPARTQFLSYRKAIYAMQNNPDSSANYSNLNGKWAFRYFEDGRKMKSELYDRRTDLGTWDSINLPLSWQMAGCGDAVLADKAFDFATKTPIAPSLPGVIPAAMLATDFVVPFDFTDRALYLYVGAGNSQITVYINGQQAGYSMNARTATEINISKYVERGLNRLAIRVDRWSLGSYLEDQKGWRFSGLNRDIYLFAQPKIRMRDCLVRTTLDPTYENGLLETAMLLKTELLNAHTVTVFYDLYDPEGKLVNQNSKDVNVGMRAEDTVRFTATIMGVKKWNAEKPELYTIMYRVKREGRFTEYITQKVGFRSSEVKGDKYLLNGQPLIIKGVNWSEFDPATGNAVNKEVLEKQLLELRRTGFNAIRTEYPMPEIFYNLCDQIGFYVVDVANINSAGLSASQRKGGTLANNPLWRGFFVERVVNTYERAKNHPSVIMWALGESAGNGYNMYQAYIALREREQTRPIIYDGAGEQWNSDISCPLFPEKVGSSYGKPFIPSRVNFDPIFWSSAGSQGAFVSGYQNLAITTSGVKQMSLSNDYKLTPLTLQPVGQQTVGDFFANIVITPVDAAKGIYNFENRLQFVNLSQLEVSYTIYNGSKILKQGLLNVDAAPNGGKAEVVIPNASGTKNMEVKIGNLLIFKN